MTRRNTFRIAVRKFGPFEAAIRKQWELFDASARTGLTLEAQPLDLHDLQDALFTREELKHGDWDVAFLNTDWVGAAHASRSVLDLSPHIRNQPPEDYPQGWTRSLLRFQEIDGFTVGLPYHDGPECLIYRTDLFENSEEQQRYQQQFGTPLRPPRTWDEFHQIARFFQRPDRNLYGTVFAAFPDGHNTVYDFLLQLWTRGGNLFNRSGEVDVSRAECIDALTFYRAMLNDASAVHPACRAMDSVKSGLAFAAGEIAMMVNWFGFASMCQILPNSKVKDCVNVSEVPCAKGGASASLNVYWILSIPAGTPRAEIAYKFVRHCASRQMDKVLTLEGGIGCRRSTWEDPDVNRQVPFYRYMETLHAHAREIPRRPDWPEIAQRIDHVVLETINTDRPISELVRLLGE